MEGKASQLHREFLLHQNCDVLLLTEVHDDLLLDGYDLVQGAAEMVPARRWAAIASKTAAISIESPHPASTVAQIGGTTFVSSILPWAGSGGKDPWCGPDHPARMIATLDALS